MANLGLIEVVHVTDPFPGLRRVQFKGGVLGTFPADCGGAYLKLFFPHHPKEVPDLSFRKSRRKGGATNDPIVRTYTVRAFDVEAQLLAIDFVIHEAPGTASDWARQARAGQKIGLRGPMLLDVLSGKPEWNLFVGDLSALPLISALVERLPANTSAHVLVELPSPTRVSFDARCNLTVTQHVGELGQSLPKLVHAVKWPNVELARRVCVAAESTPTVAIRRYLQYELGFPKECMYTVPYWKHAVSEENYHDQRHAELDAMEE